MRITNIQEKQESDESDNQKEYVPYVLKRAKNNGMTIVLQLAKMPEYAQSLWVRD